MKRMLLPGFLLPRFALLLPLLALLPLQASAQVVLLSHTAAKYSSGDGSQPVTTTAIDTTGASLIAICATGTAGNRTAPTDSAGNKWQLVSTLNEDGDVQVSLWYALGPVTSATHTFTFKGQAPAGAVMAFSNVASGPDKQSQAIKSQGNLMSGELKPSNANELVVSCVGSFFPSTVSSASPMKLVDRLPYTEGPTHSGYSGSEGTASAYLYDTSDKAINPAWSFSQDAAGAAVSATFFSTITPGVLAVTTASLPEAFAGRRYKLQLELTGGIGPYTWALSSGTLPDGMSVSASGAISGIPSAAISATPLAFKVTDSKGGTATSNGFALTIAPKALTFSTTGECARTGKQYTAYAGCTLAAAGGTPPYTYAWKVVRDNSSAALPEGLVLNSSTGAITGTVYGMGTYMTDFVAKDSLGTTATTRLRFSLAGDSTLGGCKLFPDDSIFHRNLKDLPVDTSPAAPILPAYQAAHLRVFFGGGPSDSSPNGVPFMRVPYNQPLVPVATTMYQHYFTEGPIPAYATVEGTSNAGDDWDRHVLLLQTAGGGEPCELWEMWHGVYLGGANGAWTDASNVVWDNLGSDEMIPQEKGSTDAAGLPILPLLLNADEVIGTGTPSAPKGAVRHPVRFTVNHMLGAYVWPATQHAGVGGCTGGYEDNKQMLEQSDPPTSCTHSGPNGEIYRLKASVETPACAAHSPQAAVIIEGFRNYGIILADNGMTGGLIGTPDSRWNDEDLSCLTQIKLSDFEPVNVSGVALDILTSYGTK